MTLTKQDIAENLVNKHALSRNEAKFLVENTFEILKDTIVSGEAVKLHGLGNFQTSTKSARPGRNPKTNEPHEISARRVCTFKAGSKLRLRCEIPKKG